MLELTGYTVHFASSVFNYAKEGAVDQGTVISLLQAYQRHL